MKALLFLTLLVPLAQANAEPQSVPSAPKRLPTHEELMERRRQAAAQAAERAVKPAENAVDPSKGNKPASLMSRSEILCFEGIATMVPKRAIINKPKALEERMSLSDGARLTSWTQFYEANRGWIKTMEVTRQQAEGNEPFSEEAIKSLQGSSAVVVATFRGAPISVLPLKNPEPKPESPAPKP